MIGAQVLAGQHCAVMKVPLLVSCMGFDGAVVRASASHTEIVGSILTGEWGHIILM